MSDRLFTNIYTRYVRDVQVITGLMPAEYKTLSELLSEEKPAIRLRDGSRHDISREELERLASIVPWYIHSLVKIPIVVVKIGDTYRLACDRWCMRAVELVLGKDMSLDPDPRLRLGEVEELVRGFKSIVFITIMTGSEDSTAPREESE